SRCWRVATERSPRSKDKRARAQDKPQADAAGPAGSIVLAPSDVHSRATEPAAVRARPNASRVHVGGRVLSVRGRALVVGDALHAIRVSLARTPRGSAAQAAAVPLPGDLVVIAGERDGARLRSA